MGGTITPKYTHIKIQKEKLEKIPLIEDKIKQTNKEEEELFKDLSTIESSFKFNKDFFKETIEKLEKNKSYLEQLDCSIDFFLDIELFSEYELKIKQILASNNKVEQVEEKLSALNSKISSQKSLNSELKDFISKGLELISGSEEKSCPLCLTDFNTYKELSDSISSNPLIDNLLKSSLTEKANLEIQIKKIRSANSVIKNEITNFIEKLIFKEEENKNKTNSKLEELNLLLEKNRESLKVLKNEKEILLQFFEELSSKDFKTKVNTEIKILEKKVKDLKLEIGIVNLGIEKVKNLIDKTLKESQSVKNSIEEEKKTAEFIMVEKYFKERIKSNTIDLTVLNSFISEIESNLKDIQKKFNDQEIIIKNSNDFLASNTLPKDELYKQIDFASNVYSLNNKVVKNFENYIHSDFKIDLFNLSQHDATLQFEKLRNSLLDNITSHNEILKYYKIVESLKDNVYTFLETEKTKDSIEEIKKEIKVYQNIDKSLKNEKENLEKYLKETIDSFFYTELINKIYSKIDPHPNNYRIEFDCDFSDSKPRLQVYTSDSDNKKTIPALYFSSAQINILSLSIFLARALKASNSKTKESIKCIFIDDPIQSMDSINILSFIDLFRSLSVNLDRQLIVSTHEENFHLLLQKKIPEKLFDSKFIQFETFGKLEKVADA
jgi:exonuclease SbcC